MNQNEIATDIARGHELRNRIKSDTAELKLIEKRLESVALLAPHIPLQDAEREGKQTILSGAGLTLPVVFESDLLIGSFTHGSSLHDSITLLLNHEPGQDSKKTLFGALFKSSHTYERRISDGHKFRLAAKCAVPTNEGFNGLMHLLKSRDKDGIVKSKTVIAWDQIKKKTP